jgi:serine/threonine-protein kinase RsbW
MPTIRLPAKTESLERLRAFVLDWVNQCGISAQTRLEVDLVLEELLTNVINYAYPDESGDVEVGYAMEGPKRLCLTVKDWGKPFNPLACAEPALYADVEDRKVGGLGIYLVRHIADRICYRRLGDSNVLEVSFDLNK